MHWINLARDKSKHPLIIDDYLAPCTVEKSASKCRMRHMRFAGFSAYSYQNLPAYRSVILWWIVVVVGLRDLGAEGAMQLVECVSVSVCVCGHVNLAETWDEKIHSPLLLFPGDCTSRLSLGGAFLSSAMRLPSKGRISEGHATGFVFSRQWLIFFISPPAEAHVRVHGMVVITRLLFQWMLK